MKLTKRQLSVWLYFIRQLRGNFDPGVPIVIRSLLLADFCGDCSAEIKLDRLIRIKIRINSDNPWQVKAETLIHEWAHAMEWPSSWQNHTLKRVHNETWGVWYAKIYQHLFDRCWADMGKRGLLSEEQIKLFPFDTYKWEEE